MILAIYFAATLGQPMLPFKGAYLILIGALRNMLGRDFSYVALTVFTIVMSVILMLLYLLFVKFVIRPDLDKLKSLDISSLGGEKLEPLNAFQKAYLVIFVLYLICIVVPPMLTSLNNPVINKIAAMGTLGVTAVGIALCEFVHIKGKAVLPMSVAGQKFGWDMYFLVPVAVFLSGCLTNQELGIMDFIKVVLNPVFSGKPLFVFIAIILLIAVLLTQVSTNVGVGILMFPIILAFAGEYTSVNPAVLSLLSSYIVFVAVCLPAASPYCSVLHSRRDLVSFGSIQKLYIPMMLISVVVYTMIGYPLLSLLIH